MPTLKFLKFPLKKFVACLLALPLLGFIYLALNPTQALAVTCPAGTTEYLTDNGKPTGNYDPAGKPTGHCSCPGDPQHDCGVPADFGNGCTNPNTLACLKQPKGFISTDLQPIVNTLSGLVGIAIIGTIILGGIQYSTAGGDNAEASAKAKKRIMQGVTALIAFMFLFAFIQWLIPGGIFG